jgi:hypothetical protein
MLVFAASLPARVRDFFRHCDAMSLLVSFGYG